MHLVHSITTETYHLEITPPRGPNAITILTGANGTGKSRMLINLIRYFANLLEERLISGRIDQDLSVGHIGLPSKIIAQTFSPFSKFPSPVNKLKGGAQASLSDTGDADTRRYVPIGFHRSTLHSSGIVRKVIEESLTAFVEGGRNNGRALASALSHLGYKASVSITYKRLNRDILNTPEETLRAALEAFLEGRTDNVNRDGVGGTYSTLLKEIKTLGKAPVIDRLFYAINLLRNSFLHSTDVAELNLTVDFADINPYELELLRAGLYLRRSGFLQLRGLNLEQNDEKPDELCVPQRHLADVSELSSGQLQIIGTVFSLATTVEDGSLILIDEPELSLHPTWQQDWLALLEGALQGFVGCHVFVATHSPLVVSAALEQGYQVISLENAFNNELENSRPRHVSVEETLTEVFATPIANNSYLAGILFDAVTKANAPPIKRRDILNKLMNLQHIYSKVPEILELIHDATELLNGRIAKTANKKTASVGKRGPGAS